MKLEDKNDKRKKKIKPAGPATWFSAHPRSSSVRPISTFITHRPNLICLAQHWGAPTTGSTRQSHGRGHLLSLVHALWAQCGGHTSKCMQTRARVRFRGLCQVGRLVSCFFPNRKHRDPLNSRPQNLGSALSSQVVTNARQASDRIPVIPARISTGRTRALGIKSSRSRDLLLLHLLRHEPKSCCGAQRTMEDRGSPNREGSAPPYLAFTADLESADGRGCRATVLPSPSQAYRRHC